MFNKLDPSSARKIAENLENGRLQRDLKIGVVISRSAFGIFVVSSKYEFKEKYCTTTTADEFTATNVTDMLKAVEHSIKTYMEMVPMRTKETGVPA